MAESRDASRSPPCLPGGFGAVLDAARGLEPALILAFPATFLYSADYMKRITLAALAVLLLGSAGHGQGPEPRASEWLLERYTGTEEEAAEAINALVAAGQRPVGIDLEMGLTVLYHNQPDVEARDWLIYEFSDLSRVNQELTAYLRAGWIPLGLARAEGSLVVLFGTGQSPVLGWRIDEVPLDPDAIEANIAAFAEEGFHLHGLATSDEVCSLLYVRTESAPYTSSELVLIPDSRSAIKTRIDEALDRGFRPFGFSVEDGWAYILLVK